MPLLLLVLLAPAVACDAPATRADLVDALERAEEAWSTLDRMGFDTAWEAARERIDCLVEPILPEEARLVHRIQACAFALARDDAAARAAFASILAVDPTWELPAAMAPPTHRLRIAFEAARSRPRDPRRAVRAPRGGTILVDGLPSGDVPVLRPVIVQALDGDGRVSATGLLEPGAPAPVGLEPYVSGPFTLHEPISPVEPTLPAQAPRNGTLRHPAAVPLLVAAAVSTLAAGGLYAGAAVQADRMETGEIPCADLDTARSHVNGLVVGSGIAALVGMGTGAAGIALFRF
ncbi:MAG: hypothetical protein JXB39_03595 [Deltaproteobacteria bacterium]|nr:hypothetical protein [Deltaproteobacteria bacterium]